MPKSRKGSEGKRKGDPLREAVVLVPLSYNDRTEVPPERIAGILDEVFAAFAGWTIEGRVKGAYRMQSGKKKVEDLMKVSIVLKESHIPRLEAMIAVWAGQLGQETMLLKVSDSSARFIQPRSEGEP